MLLPPGGYSIHATMPRRHSDKPSPAASQRQATTVATVCKYPAMTSTSSGTRGRSVSVGAEPGFSQTTLDGADVLLQLAYASPHVTVRSARAASIAGATAPYNQLGQARGEAASSSSSNKRKRGESMSSCEMGDFLRTRSSFGELDRDGTGARSGSKSRMNAKPSTFEAMSSRTASAPLMASSSSLAALSSPVKKQTIYNNAVLLENTAVTDSPDW